MDGLSANIEKGFKKLDAFDVAGWKKDHEVIMQLLQDVSLELDSLGKDVGIAKTTGGSVAVLGGLLSAAGVVVAPFTLGASLVLTGVGIGLGIGGGVTSSVSGMVESIQNKKKLDDIDRRIARYITQTNQLQQIVLDLLEALKEFSDLVSKNIIFLEAFRKNPNDLEQCIKMAVVALISGAFKGDGVYRIYDIVRISKAITTLSRSTKFSADFIKLANTPGLQRALAMTTECTKLSRVLFKSASIAVGIGFGIYDICEGAIAIQDGSKAAQNLRKFQKELEDNKKVLVEAIDALTKK